MTRNEPFHEPTAAAAADAPLSPRDRRLWLGAALPPLAWTLHLFASYALVYPSMRLGTKAFFAFTTLACLSASIFGAFVTHSARRASDAEPEFGPPGSPQSEAREHAAAKDRLATRAERVRFVAESATSLGIFFAIVILAQTVPIVLFGLEEQ
jgi:hypothetical protein